MRKEHKSLGAHRASPPKGNVGAAPQEPPSGTRDFYPAEMRPLVVTALTGVEFRFCLGGDGAGGQVWQAGQARQARQAGQPAGQPDSWAGRTGRAGRAGRAGRYVGSGSLNSQCPPHVPQQPARNPLRAIVNAWHEVTLQETACGMHRFVQDDAYTTSACSAHAAASTLMAAAGRSQVFFGQIHWSCGRGGDTPVFGSSRYARRSPPRPPEPPKPAPWPSPASSTGRAWSRTPSPMWPRGKSLHDKMTFTGCGSL